ncbi:MAG TPA: hypothetical protein VME66_10420, partial [Candidatus Acidoferrales bacterium]|nr:hypothetical protein [Candidatus Acidoferrales bacterium]
HAMESPSRTHVASLSPPFAAGVSTLTLLIAGLGMGAGAQTIDTDAASLSSWTAPGTSQSNVIPLNGQTAPTPVLARSAAVRFVDEAKVPTARLVGNPAIHVTDVTAAPTPKIAVDPRVSVSDDSKAAPLPAPVDANVQVIVEGGS